jgi:hypothetical protein
MKLECHREVWIEYSRVINVCLSGYAIKQVIPRSRMLLQKLTANLKNLRMLLKSPYVTKPAILCPVHKLPIYRLKIQFNIILLLRTRPSEWPSSITLFNNKSMHIFEFCHSCYMYISSQLLPENLPTSLCLPFVEMGSQWEKDKIIGVRASCTSAPNISS